MALGSERESLLDQRFRSKQALNARVSNYPIPLERSATLAEEGNLPREVRSWEGDIGQRRREPLRGKGDSSVAVAETFPVAHFGVSFVGAFVQ